MSILLLEGFELVLVDDFSGDEAKEDVNVFFLFHGDVEVKIFQVKAKPFCHWIGHGGIDEYFC